MCTVTLQYVNLTNKNVLTGRDPAGMKGSSLAVAHPDDDLYNGDHGRYVLYNSPG